MRGSVMKRVEGDVQGWGRKDWGAECSPSEPAPQPTPIGTPVPTKEGGTGTPTGPNAKDRHQARRTDQKLGPTPQPPRNYPNPQTPIPSPTPEEFNSVLFIYRQFTTSRLKALHKEFGMVRGCWGG
ncbi:hypothetical protein AMECASPLE_030617 [Ameca splendens]|uniref:Uncharacterized protein n=1 Tax=Ameca splendens TaxID=208324 RepID=A0ABV0XVB1_9TELE